MTPDHRFPIEDECVLVAEMDGVRILSTRSHELLQEVPLVCQDIFKIASMAPGALLLEAHREYEVRPGLLHWLTGKLVLQQLTSVCLRRNRARRLTST